MEWSIKQPIKCRYCRRYIDSTPQVLGALEDGNLWGVQCEHCDATVTYQVINGTCGLLRQNFTWNPAKVWPPHKVAESFWYDVWDNVVLFCDELWRTLQIIVLTFLGPIWIPIRALYRCIRNSRKGN